jgi:hypothetical protein
MAITPPTTNLQTIQDKVRKLARIPSDNQVSDIDLQQYINTFVVYDFPEQLRTFNLRTSFSFWCSPYQDVYPTDTSWPVNNPLYDFQNKYLTIHGPVYIAGYQSFFTQSPEQFFGIYPLTNSILGTGFYGNGVATKFSGVITNNTGVIFNPSVTNQATVLLKNNVLFSSVDANGNGLALIDYPASPLIGYMGIPGVPATEALNNGQVNYLSGAYTVTFPNAPGANYPIDTQTIPSTCTLPQALMYYANKITLRPVPDQPYQVNFEVYQNPTALLNSAQNPALNEYWQYIAYGAAKKVMEDRADEEGVQRILPEFDKQERLCLRRTIVQYTNERTATIYTEQTSFGANQSGWGANGGPF